MKRYIVHDSVCTNFLCNVKNDAEREKLLSKSIERQS